MIPGIPFCNPHAYPAVVGDCWYNCTSDDIAGEDKKQRLRKVQSYLQLLFLKRKMCYFSTLKKTNFETSRHLGTLYSGSRKHLRSNLSRVT